MEAQAQAKNYSLQFYFNVNRMLDETSQEIRSLESELHRNTCEMEMVKMTSNHQQYFDLFQERRMLERSLFNCEKRFLNLNSLEQINFPMILN